MSVGYGLASAAIYTWLWPMRRSWAVFFRSAGWFTLAGIALTLLFCYIFI